MATEIQLGNTRLVDETPGSSMGGQIEVFDPQQQRAPESSFLNSAFASALDSLVFPDAQAELASGLEGDEVPEEVRTAEEDEERRDADTRSNSEKFDDRMAGREKFDDRMADRKRFDEQLALKAKSDEDKRVVEMSNREKFEERMGRREKGKAYEALSDKEKAAIAAKEKQAGDKAFAAYEKDRKAEEDEAKRKAGLSNREKFEERMEKRADKRKAEVLSDYEKSVETELDKHKRQKDREDDNRKVFDDGKDFDKDRKVFDKDRKAAEKKARKDENESGTYLCAQCGMNEVDEEGSICDSCEEANQGEAT